MQVGDYGWGAGAKQSSNWNEIIENGVYIAASSSQPEMPEAINALMVLHIQSGYTASQIAFRSNSSIISTWRRAKDTNGWGKWYEFYTQANTTKDSNGNLKAASPIVKLFADHIETNDESEGVEMEHLGVGHYLIKGVVGFNSDGAWGINNSFVIPQDHNGKNMVLIDYEVRPDGDIEVFVFHQ
ncbi:pyocin knob domain-containing protein, partial [Providencia stuartii]